MTMAGALNPIRWLEEEEEEEKNLVIFHPGQPPILFLNVKQ